MKDCTGFLAARTHLSTAIHRVFNLITLFLLVSAGVHLLGPKAGYAQASETNTPAQQFTLTTGTSGPGRVALDPPGGTYESGTVVILTAIPDSGYKLVDWDGDLDGRSNPDTLVMDSTRSVTAIFRELPKFTLNTLIVGTGTVSLSPPGGSYYKGTKVVISAIPGAGYVHTGWQNDLRGYANPDTIVMNKDKSVTALFTAPPAPRVSSGILTSAAELAELPTTGLSWAHLKTIADLPAGQPNLSSQKDSVNVRVLAKALVYARTGIESYRLQVIDACMAAIGSEQGGTSLALGRELAAYVISADLVGLPAAKDTIFRAWLRQALSEDLNGRTLRSTHEDRPNNWGTQSGASRAAVAFYLDDKVEIARTALVFKGYMGDRQAYADFRFGALDWQADPLTPVGINPAGANLNGRNVDGVLPDDQRRAGGFAWPPPHENYVYEGLQGALVQAIILWRAGYDVWEWQDKALLRAFNWLYNVADFPAEDDDIWLPYIVNHYYHATFSTPKPSRPGKNAGWTDWLYGGRYDLSVTNSAEGDVVVTSLGFNSSNLAVLHLHAIPDSGHAFDGWGSDMSGHPNPDSLVLDAQKTVTATFVKEFVLTIETVGGGKVVATPDSPEGKHKDRTVVTVTAVADSGFVFSGWSGDVFGTNNPVSIFMNRDKLVTATFSQIGGDGTTTLTFEPSDDAQVKSSRPLNNYGASASLKVDAQPLFNSYLKFKVTGVHGEVRHAKIQMFVLNGSADGGAIYPVSNKFRTAGEPWNEEVLTWENAPAISGTPLSTLGKVNVLTVVEFDVSTRVVGNGTYSFGISNTLPDKAQYSSKEGVQAPKLVLLTRPRDNNQPPVASNDAATTNEETPVVINVTANDHDADGTLDLATVTLVDLPNNGTAEVNVLTGAIRYTPATNFSGSDSFTYTVADDEGLDSNVATVTVVVVEQNDAPVAENDTLTTAEDTPVSVSVLANDSDPDGTLAPTSVTVLSRPLFGSVIRDSLSGSMTYTPDLNFFGQDSLTYIVKDNFGVESNAATVLLTVTPVNDAPVAADDSVTTRKNIPVSVPVTANDREVDGQLDLASLTIVDLPAQGTATVDTATGAIQYEPFFNLSGSDLFSYTVADDDGLVSNTAVVRVRIIKTNDPPVAADDSATTAEDVPVAIAVIANDHDPDGTLETSSVTVLAGPEHGAAVLDSSTGEMTYTPFNNYFGPDSFAYHVKDDLSVASNAATVRIAVSAVNDAPVARDDSATTAANVSIELHVLSNDVDVDNALDASSVVLVTSPQNGTASVDHALGTMTYVPAPHFAGADSFSYTVADDAGLVSNRANVLIEVTPGGSEETLSFSPTDDGQIKLTLLGKNYGTKNTAKVKAGKFKTYFKFAVSGVRGAVRSARLRLKVADGASDGADSGGSILSAANTFSGTNEPWNELRLNGQNAPEVTSAVLSTLGAVAPGEVVEFDVTGAVSGNGVYSFCLTTLLGDQVRYYTKEGATPPELIVETGAGASRNDAPVAVDDTVTTPSGSAVDIEVTANDSDADGSLDLSTVAVITPALSGQAVVIGSSGKVRYTPAAGFSGADAFHYTVSDNDGAVSNGAKVIIIIVAATNQPPLALNDTTTTPLDTPVEIDVLANDSDSDGALDSTSLTIVAPPLNGSATIAAGRVVYVPNAGFLGRDRLKYQVADNRGLPSNPATVIIRVTESSQPQTLTFQPTDDGQVRLPNFDRNYGTKSTSKVKLHKYTSYYKFSVTGVTGKVERVRLRLEVSSGSTHGGKSGGTIFLASNRFVGSGEPWNENELTALNAPEVLSETLATLGRVSPDEVVEFDVSRAVSGNGIYSFCLMGTSSDAVRYHTKEGATPPELIVEAGTSGGVTNQPPVARNDSASTTAGTAVAIDVTTNDSDSDGTLDLTSVVIVKAPINGTVMQNGSPGVITYTPNDGFDGLDSLQYVVSDNEGASSNAATVKVEVTPASGGAGTFVFIPTDDGQIKLTRPMKNYGDKTSAKVAKKRFQMYLKFAVSGLNGAVSRAFVRLRVGDGVTDGGNNGGAIFLASNDFATSEQPWTEELLNATNAPEAASSALSAVGSVAPDTFVEFEVTDAVTGNGTYSFCLKTTSGDQVRYRTKEGVIPPELVVEILPSSNKRHEDEQLVLNASAGGSAHVPQELTLRPAYPNPFNAEATIAYALPRATRVKLQIFNVRGQLVRTLADGWQEAGLKKMRWSGRDNLGSSVGSGVYFVRMEASGRRFNHRIVLQK
ncbi:MAG: Ig-like domain-containing protein [bacterium]